MQRFLTNLLLFTSSVVAQIHGRYGNVYNTRSQTVGLRSKLFNITTPQPAAQRCAFCRMEPNTDLGDGCLSITGPVLFSQIAPNGKLKAYFNLQGFPQSDSQSLRAMHVHQYGVVNGRCSTTGPHYNPRNVNHPRHPGDFNNFKVKGGRIVKLLINLKAKLFGQESILGRGLVLHEQEDDLGLGGNKESLKTGNSGRRLACCTITLTNCDLWNHTVTIT
ncbi:extracellular superoxide dismutase [Cu-Zn]-like [Mobula hypostoma]|uniref:extracellular superoxide dismutase [Cu-Zn]-like n=1 Tax=Mobula hypostoma TaxID=723540 RepID=UPI002FC2D83B